MPCTRMRNTLPPYSQLPVTCEATIICADPVSTCYRRAMHDITRATALSELMLSGKAASRPNSALESAKGPSSSAAAI
jgi:hypothetical protein